MKNLQAQPSGARFVAGVQIHREFLLRPERLNNRGVGDGYFDRTVLPVAGGKSASETLIQLVAPLFAEMRDERVVQVILPAAHRPNNLLFDRANVECRDAPRLGANND